jgi:hypothetical protein
MRQLTKRKATFSTFQWGDKIQGIKRIVLKASKGNDSLSPKE